MAWGTSVSNGSRRRRGTSSDVVVVVLIGKVFTTHYEKEVSRKSPG
jgi:hypothetical protein